MYSYSESPELARVVSRRIPLAARDPETICQELELPRRELDPLYVDGYLSFDPRKAGLLDEAHEAELRFLGSILSGGYPRSMLRILLRDLDKPYAFDIRRMFYDWQAGCWRLLHGEADPEDAFFALLDRLKTRDAHDQLLAIRAWIDEALDLEDSSMLMFGHSGSSGPPEARDGEPPHSDQPDAGS